MIYLTEFCFPDGDMEYDVLAQERHTCYDSYYPFGVLPERGLASLTLEPITVLYGGNGSGKSTALNVMAEKLALSRGAPYNRSSFFEDYVRLCTCRTDRRPPQGSAILTSDDVFDRMLDLRSLNQGIDRRREELFQECLTDRYAHFQFGGMNDLDRLKRVNLARGASQSQYVRGRLMDNAPEHSNGESAFRFFCEKIRENALYLLDEPENSLSPARQQELAEFLENSARFYGCQFVLATHSPFLLAMRGAKIYDLDAAPARVRHWTQLENVRQYRDFFKRHEQEFDDSQAKR